MERDNKIIVIQNSQTASTNTNLEKLKRISDSLKDQKPSFTTQAILSDIRAASEKNKSH